MKEWKAAEQARIEKEKNLMSIKTSLKQTLDSLDAVSERIAAMKASIDAKLGEERITNNSQTSSVKDRTAVGDGKHLTNDKVDNERVAKQKVLEDARAAQEKKLYEEKQTETENIEKEKTLQEARRVSEEKAEAERKARETELKKKKS